MIFKQKPKTEQPSEIKIAQFLGLSTNCSFSLPRRKVVPIDRQEWASEILHGVQGGKEGEIKETIILLGFRGKWWTWRKPRDEDRGEQK